MEFECLLTLIEKVSASNLDTFDYDDGSLKLTMKKKKKEVVVAASSVSEKLQDAAQIQEFPASEEMEADSEIMPVKAPLVGTFYNAASPDSEPFVSVGDTVKKGQVLGIIEAMKLMNEIESEYDGVVEAILVENEQMVEYGQPLFLIK